MTKGAQDPPPGSPPSPGLAHVKSLLPPQPRDLPRKRPLLRRPPLSTLQPLGQGRKTIGKQGHENPLRPGGCKELRIPRCSPRARGSLGERPAQPCQRPLGRREKEAGAVNAQARATRWARTGLLSGARLSAGLRAQALAARLARSRFGKCARAGVSGRKQTSPGRRGALWEGLRK